RDAVSSLLATTRSWMEDGAEVAKATEKSLKEKLGGLKKLVEPIQARRKEGEARPEKVKAFKETLEKTDSLMTMVQQQVKDTVKAKSEWAELQSSSSASAAEAAASASATPAADTDADVEPADGDAVAASSSSSSSSTSSASAEPPKPTTYSFTSEDLTLISGVYNDVSTWFTEQSAAQKKLSAHEDPVLLTSDLEAKEARLQDVMQQLVAKKLRFANEYAGGQQQSGSSKKSKTSSKSKSAKSSKTKKGKSSSTATGKAGSVTPKASKAAESEKGKEKAKKGPTFITMGADGKMPTEEEILKAVRENGAEDGEGEGESEGKGHDEL
ncbi:lumenal Hsp70 protein, partial [Oleoguttula sp. CCFEE 5521]